MTITPTRRSFSVSGAAITGPVSPAESAASISCGSASTAGVRRARPSAETAAANLASRPPTSSPATARTTNSGGSAPIASAMAAVLPPRTLSTSVATERSTCPRSTTVLTARPTW